MAEGDAGTGQAQAPATTVAPGTAALLTSGGTASAAAPSATATAAGQPPAADGTWFAKAGVADADTLQWLHAKAYADNATQIAAHRNLERLLGSEQRVIVPQNREDAAGWDKVYNQLGRPEKPEGYEFSKIEGGDKSFTGWAEKTFHQAGLSKWQAEQMAQGYQAYAAEQQKQAQEQFQAKAEAEFTQFERRQGQAFDRSMAMMKRVLDRDGLSDNERFALENALGTARFLDWLHSRAKEVAEDLTPGNTIRASGPMSAEAAKAKIKELTADPTFTSRYLNDDRLVRQPAVDEMTRLQTIANGGVAP
jgi:hypothetical protein